MLGILRSAMLGSILIDFPDTKFCICSKIFDSPLYNSASKFDKKYERREDPMKRTSGKGAKEISRLTRGNEESGRDYSLADYHQSLSTDRRKGPRRQREKKQRRVEGRVITLGRRLL